MSVSVFSASSATGRAAVAKLIGGATPSSVRAIFRSEEKASSLRTSTASVPSLEIVTGIDAYDASARLVSAFRGTDVAILVTPHDPSRGFADDAMLQINMMNAAAEAGVQHIINVGSWTVRDADHVSMIAARFVPPEAHLAEMTQRHPNLSWTSIRSGFFMSPNLVNMFGSLRMGNELVFPAECAFSPCDPRDVGRVAAAVAADAVAALDASPGGHPSHSGAKYDVSGPELLTVEEMAAVFARALDRPIRLKPVPLEAFAAKMPAPALEELLLHMGRRGADAVPFEPRLVEELTGESAVRLEEWVRENAAAFERAA